MRWRRRDVTIVSRCAEASLKSHGVIRGGVYRGRGDIQVSGAAAGPVGQKLFGGPPEYQEGTPSIDMVSKVTTEGGVISFFVRNVLSGSGTGGFTL